MKPESLSRPNVHDHARAHHALQLAERLQLHWLLAHWPPTLVWSAYMFLNGFVSIALLALLAVVTRSSFVFPSLGPTAFLFFFTPLAQASSPRNAVLGHAIGLVCGFGAYSLTGMHGFPQGPHGVYWPRVLAAALSLSLTGATMVLLGINHPPAGATTMIVSLGILSKPEYLVVIEAAVILLTAQAFAINRLAGLPFPLWREHTPEHAVDKAGRE